MAFSLLNHVRSLRTEAGPDFDAALSTAATLLENILEHPAEEKYRTVRHSNNTFQRRLGRFPSGLALLRAVGFEDATQDPEAAAPTHLALPDADAAALAHAFVVLRAAQEAAQQVDGGGDAAVSDGGSGGSGGSGGDGGGGGGSASSAAPAASSASSARAQGKRPATTAASSGGDGSKRQATAPCPAASTSAGADEGCGVTAVGAAVELASYGGADIDSYFLALCGGAFLEGLSKAGAAEFARLVATARDAQRVTASLDDSEAHGRAQHWASALEENGRLLGWSFEDHDADEDAEDAGGGGGSGGAGGGGGSSSGGGGAAAGGEPDDDDEPTVVADDGNFDVCAVCSAGGSLICCEACPQAYHAGCLGPDAPPEDEDDDAAWFCPPCALQLGMRQGAA
jgi:uncharacterized membrane protein YgcG